MAPIDPDHATAALGLFGVVRNADTGEISWGKVAAGVVAANAKAAEDDDLPPGHAPAPVSIPDSVTVPVHRVLPLLQASKAALALLRRKGLGSNIETVELAEAIEEADHG